MIVMECDLETGIRMAIERTLPLSVTPRLVAVYGYPNAGKSYFLRKLTAQFPVLGKSAHACNSPNFPGTYTPLILEKDYLIFHIGDDISHHSCPAAVDVSLDTFRYLKRNIDLSVAIYNPSLHPTPHAQVFTHPQTGATFQYDLIIANPGSVRK